MVKFIAIVDFVLQKGEKEGINLKYCSCFKFSRNQHSLYLLIHSFPLICTVDLSFVRFGCTRICICDIAHLYKCSNLYWSVILPAYDPLSPINSK